MAFFQEPPRLENTYLADQTLQSFLRRHIPEDARKEMTDSLSDLGELAAGELRDLALEYRKAEPELIHWDAWGNRIDEIRIPLAWARYKRNAAEHGLVATAYERKHGALSRIHQFALAYLADRSTHSYNCPLAMTDGAAKTLLTHGNQALVDRAVPRLTSRDPEVMWTAGQWMTERTGGSDVGLSETMARESEDGWQLYGTKWFTSASTSEMALTLGRPEGNPPGGKGLALFYLELRGEDGRLNGLQINRLKEKLGTRMLPTAEISLDGAHAIPVTGLDNGIRNITPLLNITRTWNAVCSVASHRHGIALARDFAKRRVAFGGPLSEKPLHLDTLADMEATFQGAFYLTFELVRLLGRDEMGETTEEEQKALRLLYPLTKLLTARKAVANASETLEAFGGAGYVEDTGLPQILRDTQVLSIWEGTTNVLSLDCLRAIAKEESLSPFMKKLRGHAETASHPDLKACALTALNASEHAAQWLQTAFAGGTPLVEAGARRFALTMGRAMSLALLIDHAQWALDTEEDPLPLLAAKRYAALEVDTIDQDGLNPEERKRLAMNE